jgi:hypothetical protein
MVFPFLKLIHPCGLNMMINVIMKLIDRDIFFISLKLMTGNKDNSIFPVTGL